MVMDAAVERFAEQSPITLMARLALQRALEPAWTILPPKTAMR